MASGHVNRANRPNTWLHRPDLQREKSSCQLGAVHTWHLSDMPTAPEKVCLWGKTGSHRHPVRMTRLTHNGVRQVTL